MKFSQRLLVAIERSREDLSKMRVTHCDRMASVFSVEELEELSGSFGCSFLVRLRQGTCDCGEFQLLHYPCRHALASCAIATMEWGQFVDPVYSMHSVFSVYRADFPPIPDESFWPKWNGPRSGRTRACDARRKEVVISQPWHFLGECCDVRLIG
ncbi:hypothetical protein PIB30_059949 [Stylosanthes scabra]|uniref:SWIM-type domain-containing protein n=1 Tax=Stylosanthes scabra TaxID=79078 RepID=A0ABU6RKJ7_9FABA|nr:hypothetical protein [Stylosanthes scabra]